MLKRSRKQGAFDVFTRMLPFQAEPYRAHEKWVESISPEAVRRAMLECRRCNLGKLDEFNARLEKAQRSLNPSNDEED
ncbi:MAG TPA: hypothetical protein VGL35_08155 [Rhizomicrobium sp.]